MVLLANGPEYIEIALPDTKIIHVGFALLQATDWTWSQQIAGWKG